MLFFFIATAFAQTFSTPATGFVPANTECLALPCDAECIGIGYNTTIGLLTQLQALGVITDLSLGIPSGITEDTAAYWAALGYIVSTQHTQRQTTGMKFEINPKLNAIFECEARNANLVWADYTTSLATIQSCMMDTACQTAFSLIVTKSATSPPEPFDSAPATWTSTHPMLSHLGVPIPATDNSIDAYCGILFTALEVENIRAINFIALYATELLPLLTSVALGGPGAITGDEVLVHCNNKVDEHIDDITQKVFVAILGTAFGSFFGGVIIASLACCCYNKRSK